MAFFKVFILSFLFLQCMGRNLNSRMFFQSTDQGTYNLYEIKFQDVTFGRCSYISLAGNEYTYEYEAKDGDIQNTDGNYQDEAVKCRAEAMTPKELVYTPVFRSEQVDQKLAEDPFINEIADNEQYLQKVRQARLLKLKKLGLLAGVGALAAAPAVALGSLVAKPIIAAGSLAGLAAADAAALQTLLSGVGTGTNPLTLPTISITNVPLLTLLGQITVPVPSISTPTNAG